MLFKDHENECIWLKKVLSNSLLCTKQRDDRDLLLWVCLWPLCWAKMHKWPLHWGWTQRDHLHSQPQRGRVLTASHTAAPPEPTNPQRARTASPVESVKTFHRTVAKEAVRAQKGLCPCWMRTRLCPQSSKGVFHKSTHTHTFSVRGEKKDASQMQGHQNI